MSTTSKPIEIIGTTQAEIDRSYKEAFAAATPKGEKVPPREVAEKLSEAHRRAGEALVAARPSRSRPNGQAREPKAAPAEGLVYVKNGKPLARQTLSFMAYTVKMGVDGLKAALAAQGVEDPGDGHAWTATIDGATIGVYQAGDKAGEAIVLAAAKNPSPPVAQGASKAARATKAAKTAPTSRKAPASTKGVASAKRATKAKSS